MLFNSLEFLLFLPLVFAVFRLLSRRRGHAVLPWLLFASLFFYGWWEPRYLALLLGSVLVNYGVARLLDRYRDAPPARPLLALGICWNLGLLGFYKYAAFVVENVSLVLSLRLESPDILLPLAISFFTFQQIAYLMDIRQGDRAERNPFRYLLFVSFFPQLISGPIVHHREMLPQFGRLRELYDPALIAPAIVLLTLGLAKTIVLADSLAMFADPVFLLAAEGQAPTTLEAWIATFAFSLQIYFDFSGYCDVAMGAALLFGVRLPVNFMSPLKATSIIDFWRLWHITLSRFLRDYLYIPLGGNRRGPGRRYLNLFITMMLGGLWHGASWNFFVWGGLHGLFLCINHGWRGITAGRTWVQGRNWRLVSLIATFFAVALAFVVFRSSTVEAAWSIVLRFFSFEGAELSNAYLGELAKTASADLMFFAVHGVGAATAAVTVIVVGAAIAVLSPNALEVAGGERLGFDMRLLRVTARPRLRVYPRWRPSVGWGIGLGLLCWLVLLSLTSVSPFLYFQF